MKFWSVLALLFLFTPNFALAAGETEPITDLWQFNDLSQAPELSAFFNNASALITIKPGAPQFGPDQMRPTVVVFNLKLDAKNKLASAKDWRAFISPYIKDAKRMPMDESANTSRYKLEFVSHTLPGEPDLHSLYLAIRTKTNVILMVYDGVGPSVGQNLPVVKRLYGEMTVDLLKKMADHPRR